MELRIPMQPTTRPWPWPGVWDSRADLVDRYQRRRFRLTLQDLAHLSLHDARGFNIDWPDPRQEIAVYVPKNLRHLIRIDSSNPVHSTGLGLPPSWSLTTPPPRNSAKSFGWFAGEDWKIPDLKNLRLEPVPLTPSMRLERGRGWEAARAGAAGALALLALVLLVRALDKCVHTNFFKTRRRQSEEWPTPNVLATSHRPTNDLDLPSSPRMDDSDFPSEGNQDTLSNDLPPPYSECANTEPNTNKYLGPEEPPPPYSACYVAYSNPKDGIPSVHFLNRRRENIFQNRLDTGQSSTMPDVNIQNANTAKESDGSDGCDNKTEFVFENGRVVQRDIDENEGNTQRNDDCVVNISESGPSGVPDRLSVQV